MTTPIPPHTELRMRQFGEAVWNALYAMDPDIHPYAIDPDVTPREAFAKGFYIALSTATTANAETSKEMAELYEEAAKEMAKVCKAKLRQQQRELELWRGLAYSFWVGLAAAVVVVGVLSR